MKENHYPHEQTGRVKKTTQDDEFKQYMRRRIEITDSLILDAAPDLWGV